MGRGSEKPTPGGPRWGEGMSAEDSPRLSLFFSRSTAAEALAPRGRTDGRPWAGMGGRFLLGSLSPVVYFPLRCDPLLL